MGKATFRPADVVSTAVSQRIVTLFSSPDPEVVIQVAEALYLGGARIFEFVNRDKKYTAGNQFATMLPVFTQLIDWAKKEHPEFIVGAGTIHSVESAQAFIEAGANFLVGPGFKAPIAGACAEAEISYIPGAFTPTEIYEASEAPAVGLVKLFPGGSHDPKFVTSVLDTAPWLRIMVTGGATPENMGDWFKAGASCVGGGKFIDAAAVAAKNFDKITSDHAAALAKARPA